MTKGTIFQILPSLTSGGIERGVIEVNNYLVKNGYKSLVLSSGGKMVYQVEQGGGKHITLNVATKNPFKMWKNINKIAKIIKDYDVKNFIRIGLVFNIKLDSNQEYTKLIKKIINPDMVGVNDIRFSQKETTDKGKLLGENNDYINKIYTLSIKEI